jgi:hypothetical protein
MPRRRPEDERRSAADIISALLQDRLRRQATDECTPAHERHYREACSLLLWKHSEAHGKYSGCRYWSNGALRSPARAGPGKSDRRRHGGGAVRHEHLFPRAQLIRKLLGLGNPSPAEVAEMLERLNIGVVVTVEEHKSLPPDGDEADPWERYRRARIEWTDCRPAKEE